uniref:Pentatricopeptide repeat-containing protein n=1 Tax=Kalanchoe fedtschenkoi TaxID=63787 RepID=A0A7N0VEN1_KALFE
MNAAARVDAVASILKNHCNSIRQLKQIHAYVIQSDLHRNNLLCSTLVFSYASHSCPRYTHLLFDSISRPNLFVFNHAIRAFAKVQSLCADSLRMYVRMVRCDIRPDNFTFPYLLNACAALGAAWSGVEVHGRVVKSGFGLYLPVMNALVDMYGKCGEAGSAHQAFDEMAVRDVVSCNAVLGASARCGKGMEIARKVFDGMVVRNAISWNAMIVGYVNSGELGLARDVFDRMEDMKDVVSWTTMLVGYTKNGLIDMAGDLFREMPQKSPVAWTAMVSGCAQNGRPSEAVAIFRKMLKEKVKPDVLTMTSVISAVARLGRPDLASWIGAFVETEKIQRNERVLTALVDMYAKCGNLKEGCRLFEEIPNPDVFPYSALITGLASHGHAHEALEIFRKMKADDVEPDCITFVGVFTACGHAGLVEDGMKFWASMIEDYRIKPDAGHYGCMVDMFGRAGRLDEAYEFIKSMPMSPKEGALGALLAACKTYGNAEIAEAVAEHLFELEPGNTGNYVLLSSIYAERGQWDDAARVREMIKNKSIVKIPGSSWVEINRKGRLSN